MAGPMRLNIAAAAAGCVLLLEGCALFPVPGGRELRLGARAIHEKSVCHNVCLSADGEAIVLEEGVLFEDDGPAASYSYKPHHEKLSDTVWMKKELIIPDPRCRKAFLLAGTWSDFLAIINGKPEKLESPAPAELSWREYALEPSVLKAGTNEIILYGEGRMLIARDDLFAAGSRTRTKHPNRSAKSTDAGRTWDYDHLGEGGDVDGEYGVRVFLEQFRPDGSLILPVIDSGNLNGNVVAPPIRAVGPVRVRMEAGGSGATSMELLIRSGTTYVPGEETWTDWVKLPSSGGTLPNPAGRYVQLRAVFATSDPLQTPRLERITIDAWPEPENDWTRKVRVLESHNEEIVRTSIPFEYEPFDHPKLRALREKYKLDDVGKGARNEFELMQRLAVWSSQAFGFGDHLLEVYPAWDALDILKLHEDGTPVGGFCQHYNLVFLQACESFGLVGRATSLRPRGGYEPFGGGHEVVEIWSNEYKKWVYVDGNTAYYAVDAETSVPLSLLELHDRQLEAFAGQPDSKAVRIISFSKTPFEWKGLKTWPPFVGLRLIPRSNFLEKESPVPTHQGMGAGCQWTGHYLWSDAAASAVRLYGNRVTKRANWDWTLNQAHIVLEATRTPGEFRVHLDTETPGFETFLTDIDGKGKTAVPSIFTWKLHEGKNRLEAQPRNNAQREGIASWIVVDYRAH